jgi:hypothetical protein
MTGNVQKQYKYLQLHVDTGNLPFKTLCLLYVLPALTVESYVFGPENIYIRVFSDSENKKLFISLNNINV